jgi:hypothetical protein
MESDALSAIAAEDGPSANGAFHVSQEMAPESRLQDSRDHRRRRFPAYVLRWHRYGLSPSRKSSGDRIKPHLCSSLLTGRIDNHHFVEMACHDAPPLSFNPARRQPVSAAEDVKPPACCIGGEHGRLVKEVNVISRRFAGEPVVGAIDHAAQFA